MNIKKSIDEILYDRLSSPFLGTFIFSWAVWNWKIWYLTIFVSQEKLKETKVDYILNYFFETKYLIVYPLISTVLLLTVMPLITNCAYWLSLIFQKWRVDKRNEVDLKQLLTLEQSIELRETIRRQAIKFDELLTERNEQIRQKNIEIDSLEEKIVSMKEDFERQQENFDNQQEANEKESKLVYNMQWFFDDKKNVLAFRKVIGKIATESPINDGANTINTEALAQLESFDAIEKKGKGIYYWTPIGKRFIRYFTERREELMKGLEEK